jgi:phospholipid/cholesterol/gamma-HCH transport system substrate-binding protein
MREHPASNPNITRRVNLGGTPFSQRNPVLIGAIGLVVILALLWGAFNASNLPLIGGGTVYSAAFPDSVGLQAGDEVRVAGIRVGAVSSVALDTAHQDQVKVTFRVKNAYVGDQSTVSIELKTLLGAKYLAIDSEGDTKQNPGTEIPTSRTVSPLDIYPVLNTLTDKLGTIDTATLAQSFDTIASAFSGTSGDVASVLGGLSRLSQTVSSRDAQLSSLLAAADSVTGVLASRDADLTKLLQDGSALLTELDQRRDAIHALLVNTAALSVQLQGLVADNQKTIGPLLDQLGGVLTILQQNQDSLDRGLTLLAPFYRVFADTLGNGRWFDTYVQNLSLPGLLGPLLTGGAS